MMKKFILMMMVMFFVPLVAATVTLEVTGFSCSPNEVAITDQFTCTATIYNSGTETASLTEVVLYPDSGNWLEYSSYSEVVNAEISSGASTEVVFESLRAQKSGVFGFSRVVMDEGVDTYPADNSVQVNVIDIVTVVTQTANSAAASTGTVDATGQVSVGGSLDLTMILSIISGGCTIGTQPSSTSFSDVTDGQTVSYTWTLTMGTANCRYQISSTASSNPSGTATKTDSTTKVITCTGTTCTTTSDDDTPAPPSGGGGGGGGGTTSNKTEDETNLTEVLEIAKEFEVSDEDVVININEISSWEEEGRAEFSDVLEGTIYSFIFVTSDLKEKEWLIVVNKINEESETAVFFLKENENVKAGVLNLLESAEFDLDNDGLIDLKITLTKIGNGMIDFYIEKSETFVAQESELASKQRKIVLGIIIVTVVLAAVLVSLILYFHVKKEKLVREYYKKR